MKDITPSELVRALEKHTGLIYDDYEYDGEEEISVERIKNVVEILDDVEWAKKNAEEAEKRYLKLYGELVEKGLEDGTRIVEELEVPTGSTLTVEGPLIFLGQLRADGTLNMLPSKKKE